MEETLDPLDLAYLMLHPARRRIIEIMASRSIYVTSLADELHMDPKVTSFHLLMLFQHKLVEGKWGTAKTDEGERAVKYYSLTEKAKEVMRRTEEWLRRMSQSQLIQLS